MNEAKLLAKINKTRKIDEVSTKKSYSKSSLLRIEISAYKQHDLAPTSYKYIPLDRAYYIYQRIVSFSNDKSTFEEYLQRIKRTANYKIY